ncbi:hypothetical protein IWZ01DRAFT_524761 [Phyllosticta capitalensis]
MSTLSFESRSHAHDWVATQVNRDLDLPSSKGQDAGTVYFNAVADVTQILWDSGRLHFNEPKLMPETTLLVTVKVSRLHKPRISTQIDNSCERSRTWSMRSSRRSTRESTKIARCMSTLSGHSTMNMSDDSKRFALPSRRPSAATLFGLGAPAFRQTTTSPQVVTTASGLITTLAMMIALGLEAPFLMSPVSWNLGAPAALRLCRFSLMMRPVVVPTPALPHHHGPLMVKCAAAKHSFPQSSHRFNSWPT